MIQLAGQFVPVKLDAEHAGKDLAAKYRVQGFPTILFLDPAESTAANGGLVARIVGYLPPESFAAQLENTALVKQLPQLEERSRRHPDDVATLGKLIVIYHLGEENTRARELLAEAEKLDPDNARGELTAALNAVADSYQLERDLEKAIPLYRKAANTARRPREVAYARESLAICYIERSKPDAAMAELESAAKLEGLSHAETAQIERLRKLAQTAAESARKSKKTEDDP